MSSGRSALEHWLVSGELKNRPSATMGTSSMCQTYVGRGWTVIDTMGFGEPLGSTIPDKFAIKMVIEFINELKGRYSHIIFVMGMFHDVSSREENIRVMWNTFLEFFPGGEKNFAVVVMLTEVTDPS